MIYTYSTIPVIDPNTVHQGLYITLCFSILFLLIVFLSVISNKDENGYPGKYEFRRDSSAHVCIGIIISICLFVAFVSFKEQPVPINESVVATLVDEGSSLYQQKTGKHSYETMVRNYLVYELPDGSRMQYTINNLQPIYQKIILYRNPVLPE